MYIQLSGEEPLHVQRDNALQHYKLEVAESTESIELPSTLSKRSSNCPTSFDDRMEIEVVRIEDYISKLENRMQKQDVLHIVYLSISSRVS